MNNLLRRSATPALACLVSHNTYERYTKQQQQNQSSAIAANRYGAQTSYTSCSVVQCEAMTKKPEESLVIVKDVPLRDDIGVKSDDNSTNKQSHKQEKNEIPGKEENEEQEPFFHDLFPLRQLWKPSVEYPLWDENWDGRDSKVDKETHRFIRKNGVTRHIILIRHGQYDETHKEDEKRILTPLGRKQAELTGQRLAKMIKGFDEKFGPCNVISMRVSGMSRAKETAEIIAQQLPESVIRADPDSNLNEGRPCHHIPGGKASSRTVNKTDDDHDRIEAAFRSYFYRADPPAKEENSQLEENKEETEISVGEDKMKPHPQHEFEIIVCHANVIRYFLCRALQIPPEAWLRLCTFNCSLTYLTVRPTGTVSCRMLGDIGHLGYEHSTFSMHHGFNW